MTERMQLDDLRGMLDWLLERPDLPLPVHGAWAMPGSGPRYGEDGRAFHVFVSEPELDALADHFDEIETAPAHHSFPIGVRRRFGTVAYEVLVDDNLAGAASWPWAPHRFDSPRGERRSERIAGLREMARWLYERPELPAPLGSAHVFGEDELVFHGFAPSDPIFLEAYASMFDRLDKPAYLPHHASPIRRNFTGGIAYQVLQGS